MPKKTFFHLPDEKRNRLMIAAHEEFTRVPFAEASVSNIIKAADIPRGSFYQYFDDKSDIFYYDLERMKQNSKSDWEDAIKKADGDLFKAFRSYFSRFIHTIIEGPDAKYFRNLFLHMDYNSSSKMYPRFIRPKKQAPPKHHEQKERLASNVNLDLLKVQSSEELTILMHQLMMTFFQTIGFYYTGENRGEKVPIERVLERFELQVDWLEFGVGKKETADD